MQRKEDYLKLVSELQKEVKADRGTLRAILFGRLLVFTSMILGVYAGWNMHWAVPVVVVVVGLVVFLVLVRMNEQKKKRVEFLEARVDLCLAEIQGLHGDHSTFPSGNIFHAVEHPYGYDLDIFGRRSFFQSLARTGTQIGQMRLAEWLRGEGVPHDQLDNLQEGIKELGEKVEFRQSFYVEGVRHDGVKDERELLSVWRQHFQTMVRGNFFWTIYRFVMPVFAITTSVLYFSDTVSLGWFVLGVLLSLGVTGMFLKRTNKVYFEASESFKVLAKAGVLVERIEQEEFQATVLKEKSASFESQNWSSEDIRHLEKIVSAFDSRLNPFVGMALNAYIAWDFWCLLRLENWLHEHGQNMGELYEQLAWWDAMGSLGTYAYNHPNYRFPVQTDEVVLEARGVGHPFIAEDVNVKNDFELKGLGDFTIITGANMAGKSTFLRTVGLSLVMARIGLPVNATHYRFQPLTMYTSMRTTDSLQANESYFYTELKRLKGIVERLDKGEKLFIILDEILKGTNSKDKAEGSKKFVQKLLKYPVAGIIATHDLSLTSLGDEYEQVKNLCFEVGFGEDDLIFDYKLEPGVCKNMNATWLLDKMNLV